MARRYRFGFTLVELLMVIGITGVVAALLLAAISHARARAQRVQCLNNVRQLGLALQEFTTDHHYYPPFLDIAATPNTEDRYWMGALRSEMGDLNYTYYYPTGVWHCPAAYRPANWDEHWVYDDYGYNCYGFAGWMRTNSLGLSEHYAHYSSKRQTQIPTPHVIESEVVNPTEMIAIGDALFGGPSVIGDGQSFGRSSDRGVTANEFPGYSFSESTARAHARHQDKGNVVFCDGHAESPTLQSLFADTSDAALGRWNRDHLPHKELLQ
jgi:prepilin-type processing-associated H-X9-DG protein/prepilin-type N-terminal cleavage/methylation domain-containing protein